jgi:Na+/H+ antiporter NhaD/arsenite permease-like protein
MAPMTVRRTVLGLLILAWPALAAAAGGDADLGASLAAWSALPFVGILLSIALFPLVAPSFWHHHYPKVAVAWGAALAIPLVAAHGSPAVNELLHMAILDYLPFMTVIATLFTIGGGIHLAGSLRGTPWTNAVLLLVGTVLASFVGTTGAAMLLIRPLLRANRDRRLRAHTVVFFIFLVANIGGALTPLGDPPLFLGFIHGVPFFWTLGLWKETAVMAGFVLAVYVAIDLVLWRREDPLVRAPRAGGAPLRVLGAHNFLFLAAVLAAVVLSGLVNLGEVTILGVHQQVQKLVRDAFCLALLGLSWWTTAPAVRRENEYSWAPIREVAVLFAAIFTTIVAPVAMLRAGERGALAWLVAAVREPSHFFWATGVLSSFLDNAPTYLTFLSTALGRLFPGVAEREAIARLIADHPAVLQAISTGAVFMGANSYIGNAPNFMVKAIAEEAGVPMPSFFGYIAIYSVPVLIPAFVVLTMLFF